MAGEEPTGVEVQSVSFRSGDGGNQVVELTFAERRDQRQKIAMYKVLIFDESEAWDTISDLMETLSDLVDEVLTKQAAPPDTRPSRRG